MPAARKLPRQTLTLDGTVYDTTFTRNFLNRKPFQPKDARRLLAIIPGLILELLVAPGERVRSGQSLLILEAMKMQNHIANHDQGTVKALHVAVGDMVTKGQLLVEFE